MATFSAKSCEKLTNRYCAPLPFSLLILVSPSAFLSHPPHRTSQPIKTNLTENSQQRPQVAEIDLGQGFEAPEDGAQVVVFGMVGEMHGAAGKFVAVEDAPVHQAAEIDGSAVTTPQVDEGGEFPVVVALDDATELEGEGQGGDKVEVAQQTAEIAAPAVFAVGHGAGGVDGDFRRRDQRMQVGEVRPGGRIPELAVAVQAHPTQTRPSARRDRGQQFAVGGTAEGIAVAGNDQFLGMGRGLLGNASGQDGNPFPPDGLEKNRRRAAGRTTQVAAGKVIFISYMV